MALVPLPAAAEGTTAVCDEVAPAPFEDRDRVADAHVEAVDCLHELDVLTGRIDADGVRRLHPSDDLTRGQLAGLLHRLLAHTGDVADLPPPREPRFDDVDAGHVFDEEIHALAAAGIIEGTEQGGFHPGAPVRRDQAAALLVRALGWATQTNPTPHGGPYFSDLAGEVHRDAVRFAFEHGIVEGTRRPCGEGGGRFSPSLPIERQQSASLLARALSSLDDIAAEVPGSRTPDETCPPPVWEPRISEARAYADARDGSVSFAAIGTDGELVGSRSAVGVPAASVLKVMFLVAYLRQPDVRDRDLTDAERELLGPMIRRSANEPATEIADHLGQAPMERLAERVGMHDFTYTRPWGSSTVSARDQARLLRELPELLPDRHREYALGLLADVVPEQRWGVGELELGAWTLHFKGGWGSGSGAVNHQVALLRHPDGVEVALAVLTTSSPGHEYASETLRETFRRLLTDLPRD